MGENLIFSKRTTPEHFLATDWDNAWAAGWFRMRQTIFTAHFLVFGHSFHSALWLRVRLPGLERDRKLQKLAEKSRTFRAEFSTFEVIDPAQERLYQKYRSSLGFEPAPTLQDLLWGEETRNFFTTHQVNLYEGERLIASGIFDTGEKAAAGITCFFDPDYRKYSLGKHVIFLKMEHCRDLGLEWFYPGYAAPGNPRFDYKWELGADALEYLDLGTDEWKPHVSGEQVIDPLSEMVSRLLSVCSLMELRGSLPKLRYYFHLDINLNPQVQGLGLFDYPVFLECFSGQDSTVFLLTIFDPRIDSYQVLQCRSVFRLEKTLGDETIFDSDLLICERVVLSSNRADDVAVFLSSIRLVG